MESLITLAVFLIGTITGYFIGTKLRRGNNVSRAKYDALAQANTEIATRLEIADNELKKTGSEKTALYERAIHAEAQARTLDQQLRQQQEQLKLEFQNTANRIFEEVSNKFSSQSEKKIGDLLNPFQQRLTDFKELVDKSFGEQGKEQRSLQTEIKRIVEMNETMRTETTNLTNALRGNVKAQGNWGEVMLERILEESGLRPGNDYILQGVDMGLIAEDGSRQQPDVTVKLPDGKHIIIDAKVSLVDYERYCSETDQARRDTHSGQFLKSVRAHINGLGQKAYQHNEKLQTPDFVLMFMPIEGAYSFAVQQDRDLHAYAWGKKIVLVCPATLFATLRTIASLWKIEQQSRNTQEIARQGGALYDKFVDFVEALNDVGKQMDKARDSYDTAMSRLKTGKDNLIRKAEKLRALEAKTTKSLPKSFIGENEENNENTNANTPLVISG